MFTRNLYSLFALLIMAVAVSSCSSRSESSALSIASADAACVISADIKALADNAGGKAVDGMGISFPDEISSRLDATVAAVAACKGVDYSQRAVVVASPAAEAVAAIVLSDPDAFAKSLAEMDLDSESDNGMQAYQLDVDIALYVDGDMAYIVAVADGKPKASIVAAFKADAEKAPLKPWQLDKLNADNDINALLSLEGADAMMKRMGAPSILSNPAIAISYDAEAFAKASLSMAVKLDGAKCDARSMLLDADGKVLEPRYKMPNVDVALLRFAAPTDIAVMMMAVPGDFDWAAALNAVAKNPQMRDMGIDPSAISSLAPVLSALDGTVMLSAGPVGARIDSPDAWQATVAAQLKPGKASEFITMARMMLPSLGFSPKSTAQGISLDIPGFGTVQAADANGTLVITYGREIADNGSCPFAAAKLKGTSGGLAVNIAADSPMAQLIDLPFGIDADYVAVGNELLLHIVETGTQGSFIENLLKL